MTIKAFECTRHWAEVPVTIFAHDLDEVDEIYRTWVATHHPEQRGEPDVVYPYSGSRLEARLLLDAAAALDTVGVGYWDRRKHAWVVVQAEDPLPGDLAPPEGRVGHYDVKSDEGDDAKVFATSFEEATTLYIAWHADRWGEAPTWFTVHMRSRWELMGELATLRDGLDAEITGVARWDNDGVSRILPPDWEPVIGRE
jgi:hypothetical protein